MAVDAALAKILNLPRTSPSFIYIEAADGARQVKDPAAIPRDAGTVWVAATTQLANGAEVESVVSFDTQTPMALKASYWWVNGTWYEPADPNDRGRVLSTLALSEDEVFPYKWTLRVPLAEKPLRLAYRWAGLGG